MEVYHRIACKVRGALWAHHRRLMPERQFQRILAYVYNNKYEYQIRFDRMTCVGTAWGGKVEVSTTPAGHIRRVRVNPAFEDLPEGGRKRLLVAAYCEAVKHGRCLMQEAEVKIYRQFLRDIKPIVMGIRDNPEFYTVPEDTEELPGGTLASPKTNDPNEVYRTIPYAKSRDAVDEFNDHQKAEKAWLSTDAGKQYLLTLRGKEYKKYAMPHTRPHGAPGPKKRVPPTQLMVPYTAMDERNLLRRNWQAYLDNKRVAEVLWTRARRADQLKRLRISQKEGRAWHSPVNASASTQW